MHAAPSMNVNSIKRCEWGNNIYILWYQRSLNDLFFLVACRVYLYAATCVGHVFLFTTLSNIEPA